MAGFDRGERRGIRSVLAAVVVLGLSLAVPVGVAAQQPTDAGRTTVIGIIRDASSGAAVIGAQITIDSAGPRGSSDDQGRFSVARVALGAHRITVRRFGYRELVQELRVEDPMAGIELRLQPDPIQLAELGTSGQLKADLAGTVRDAVTGEVLAWAKVSIAREGGERAGRDQTTNLGGAFEIGGLPLGGYLLEVERLGYLTRYVSLAHRIPAEPLEVRMDPDVEFQNGLGIMKVELENRIAAAPRSTFRVGEDQLRLAGSMSMREFVGQNLGDFWAPPCPPRMFCLFVDEAPVLDPAILSSYDTSAFYRIDVFACMRGPAGRRVTQVRAYTYAYIERTARKPQLPEAVTC